MNEQFCCTHPQKKFTLTFDGGPLGQYCLELCNSCYEAQDKKFFIKEEIINEKSRDFVRVRHNENQIIIEKADA